MPEHPALESLTSYLLFGQMVVIPLVIVLFWTTLAHDVILLVGGAVALLL